MLARLRAWARTVKRDVLALYLASRDPRTPWTVKALAIIVVGYALSPIDLIPDFVPVLGYLDDVILLPLWIMLAVKLMPPDLMAECRAKAAAIEDRPVNRVAAVVILLIWATAIFVVIWLGYRHWFPSA